MKRRDFLQRVSQGALGGAATVLASSHWPTSFGPAFAPPAYTVMPVVGDGKWTWNEPPSEGRGYLEERPYDVSIGIEMEGTGTATDIISTTTAPVSYPEQLIESVMVEVDGCEAEVRELMPGAGQLMLVAPSIEKGQTIKATAYFKLKLFKQYMAYERNQFPIKQDIPADVRRTSLGDSPGIETRSKRVKDLATELVGSQKHPWDRARAFAEWIPRHIQAQLGSYTGVDTALETSRGDCEEMAGIFVALCRAVNIPARLVWIPNHTWSEFYLVDEDKKGHWIPVHTACYFWFGWNGAHELVLQKGDRVQVPERHRQFRLMDDWTRYSGPRPEIRYTADMAPLPLEEGGDPGPGARRKDTMTGEWKVVGSHALDKYVRR
jgi:hypothetical protein